MARSDTYKTAQMLWVGIYLEKGRNDGERKKISFSSDCQNVLKKFKGGPRISSEERQRCYEGNVLQFKCIIEHWPLLSLAIFGFQ